MDHNEANTIIHLKPLATGIKFLMGMDLAIKRLVFVQPMVRLDIISKIILREMLVEQIEFGHSSPHLNNSLYHHNSS